MYLFNECLNVLYMIGTEAGTGKSSFYLYGAMGRDRH